MPGPSRKFRCRSRGRSPATSFPRPRRHSQPRPLHHAAAAAPPAPAAPAPRPPVLAPATRQHAALPAAAQARGAGRGRRDVLDVAGRQGRAGKRHRAGAQAASRRMPRRRRPRSSDPVARKLAEWLILRSDNNGASVERYRAFISANPSWPSQTFLRRRIEAALWDDRRDDATVLVLVRKRIADLGQGQVRAGARPCSRAAIAPTPNGWCARPGAATACRKTPKARRSIMFGALLTAGDHKARMDLLLYGTEQEAGGMRAAKRLGAGHVALAKARIAANKKGSQPQGAARRGAARTAQRSRLHLRAGSSCCAARRNSPRPRS